MKTMEELTREAASLLGRKGGSARSKAKTKACRENAKKSWYSRKAKAPIFESTTMESMNQLRSF